MDATRTALDTESLRAQFPTLHQTVNGFPLTYLDNAATTMRPQSVIDATSRFYSDQNANVHRGVHSLSQSATEHFGQTRKSLASVIQSPSAEQIIWTKGCTESINLVASSWGHSNLNSGDVILLSAMEHHSNIIPWQLVAEKTGANIQVIPISDSGEIILEEYVRLLRSNPVRIVGVKHICNALGTINPIAEMTQMAHANGALILVDGAQGLAHAPLNVQDVPVDFYALSAHKAYGPTGLGALYGRRDLLEAMPPYQCGGSMIRTVTFEKSTYADLPDKFEPGTPNIAGVIAFESALQFLKDVGFDRIADHERSVTRYAHEALAEVAGLRICGTAADKVAVVSFVMLSAHPHDIGTILDTFGVAIRTGHHCCMPLMNRLGVPATARASLGVYNTTYDIERLIEALQEVNRVFA